MNLPINQIICGDCAEIMKDFPDNSIDCCVTSPPYGNLRDYRGYSFKFESIAQELYRITKLGGVVVWVIGDETINGDETGESFRQALKFKEVGFNLHDTMIYEKNGCAYPTTDRYYQVFEYMFVFSKGRPGKVNLLQDRKNRWAGQKWSRKRSRRQKDGTLKEGSWKGCEEKEFGVRYNIWKMNNGHNRSTKDLEAFKHPAIFPESLAEDHILSWCNRGDLVLDPMCGSGTTCKMAVLNGRQFIGIDVSKEYCELARSRVQNGAGLFLEAQKGES